MPPWAIVAVPQRRPAIATRLRFVLVAGMSSEWLSMDTDPRGARAAGILVGPQRETRVDFLAGYAISVGDVLGGFRPIEM
jgi:hypothetical protein